MSMNLAQVFAANPITTIGNTDLMYVVTTGTTDAAINGSSFKAQFAPLTTKGDLYTFSTVNARLPVAVGDGKILQVSSGAATGLAYSTPTYPSASGTAGKIVRSDGTNNVYSQTTYPDIVAVNAILFGSAANTVGPITPAASSVLISSATSVPAMSGALANGQMIIGSTGATPVVGTITVSGNLSATVGAGTFALATTGSGNYSFVDETTTSRTLTAFQAMVADNAGVVTGTIPALAAFGDVFEIVGKGSGGWLLQANAGQTINLGSSPTTVAGSLASTNRYDAVQVVCVTANTTFVVRSVIGNLTVA